MSQLSDWKSSFLKWIGVQRSLGGEPKKYGLATARLCSKSELAREYLEQLVPDSSVSVKCFRIYDLVDIEDALTGLSYSGEFQEFGFLPIADFENDKVICIDCDYSAFVVLQLGMGTIEPIRRFMLFRCYQFSEFLSYLAWKSFEN